jgi:hypothetical protein
MTEVAEVLKQFLRISEKKEWRSTFSRVWLTERNPWVGRPCFSALAMRWPRGKAAYGKGLDIIVVRAIV